MPRYRPLAERFWEKVAKTPAGCWEWTGHRTKTGYGMVGLPRSRVIERSHRVSWSLHNGPIPRGLCVLHRCDNRACVRPDHLFLGTQRDNIADMRRKARGVAPRGSANAATRPGARQGERNGRARLTAEDIPSVRAMRARGMQYKDIAAHFGVAVPTIQHVISGRNWAHV